jgi:hypothetical protein
MVLGSPPLGLHASRWNVFTMAMMAHSASLRMAAFINPVFQAPNVVEIDVDSTLIQEFMALLDEDVLTGHFTCTQPNWASDIRWISPDTLDAFRFFQSRFERLAIASHVRPWLHIDNTVRMYSGFLVTRSLCEAPDFHVDWRDTGHQAFTLLTPITDHADDFGLLYQRCDGSVAVYPYRLGKALIFGDDFLHSTQPGRSLLPVALLSFTFGTDRMEYWPPIAVTAAHQGNLVRLPDGHFLVRNIDDPEESRRVTLAPR